MNKYIRLDECCQIALSSIDKKSKSNEKPIKLCNFTDVYYNWNIYSSMTDEFMEATASDKNIDIFSLKQGDVVITKDSETRDDIGMAAFVYEDLPNTVLGYHCALIRPLHSVDGSYLNAFLNSYLGRKHFENQASGSGQRYTLTKEALGSIKIPLIPIHRQKAIGALFSNIDKRIHNGKQTISELESLAQTIYDYWFLQFEFPNEDGKPYKSSGGKMVWNEELKREIPDGWRVGALSDIANFNMGQSPKGQSYNTNSMGYPLINGAAELTKDKIKIEKYTSKANRFSNINDWIFCIRATIGNIQCSDKEYALGRGVASATVKEETFFEYLYFLLNEMCNYYEKILIGSIISGMTREDIINYSCIIPDKRVVSKFHTISKDSFQIIESLKKEDQQLASLRDFLLPLLMNGQVTFRDADK